MRTWNRIGWVAIAVMVLAGAALLVTLLPPFGTTPSGTRLARAQRSAHYARGAFQNLEPTHKLTPGTFFEMLRHQFFGDEPRVPPRPIPIVERRAADYAAPPASGLRATWIGHASVLLELDGTRVLVDPVFSERCSPFSFVGPRRFAALPIALADLPAVQIVVISHDHYDHLDYPSILQLIPLGVPVVTSLGVGAHLESWGMPEGRITELDWWESTEIAGLTITAAPSQHFSGRSVADRNRTAWSALALRGPHHAVFFSGDTGLTQEYGEIKQKLGPFDLIMLEIGAWHPAWGDIHLGPENALQAHALLGGGAFLPVHWGTFNLAIHAWDEPAELLVKLAPTNAPLVMPRLGQPIEPGHVQSVDAWWREVEETETEAAPVEAVTDPID